MAAIPPTQAKRAFHAVTFLRWFATGLMVPFLVLFLQVRGMDLAQIGLLLGLHSLIVVALEVPSGVIADTLGRKRTAMLAQGFTVASLAVMLSAFDVATFTLAVVLLGTSRALASGALEAWCVDVLLAADPRAELQPVLAISGVLTTLGLALGSLAGGVLPGLLGARLPADGTAVLTPLALPFAAGLALHLLTLAAIALLVREVRPGPQHATGAPRGLAAWAATFRAAGRDLRDAPLLRTVLAATAAGGVAIAALETFWQPRFAELLTGGTPAGAAPEPAVFGVLMAVAFGVGVVGNLIAIPLARRLRGRHAHLAAGATILAAAALLTLAWTDRFVLAAAAFWFAYFAFAITMSPLATLVHEGAKPERRASLVSVASLAAHAGGGLGTVLFGLIARAYGIGPVWTICAAVLLLSSALLLPLERLRARTEASVADPQEAPTVS